MLIGYARISTQDQNLELQLDALKRAGCERIFQDIASGSVDERPGLQEALEFARPGDSLVCWKLDRLGRSLRHLIDTVGALAAGGIGFRSLQESLDTTSAGGRLVFHVFGALAEFERHLIRDRTLAGLAVARQHGRIGGRPSKLDDKAVAQAKAMIAAGTSSMTDVARTLAVSRATLYRYLERDQPVLPPAP